MSIAACAGNDGAADLTETAELGPQEIEAESTAPIELEIVERELSLGAVGDDVRQANRFFLRYGYFENPKLQAEYPNWAPVVSATPRAMESFGPELEAAVAAYQQRMGLEQSGAIDAATLSTMKARTCGYPDGYYDGSQQKWAHWAERGFYASNTVTYRVTGYPGAGQPTRAEIDAAIANGFAVWTGPSMLTRAQPPDVLSAGVEISWPDVQGSSGSTLAVSRGSTIWFNTNVSWGIGAVAGKFDVASVFAHELGHNLGFDHSSVTTGGTPIMWPNIDAGVVRRSPTPDDMNALMASPYMAWFPRGGLATHIGANATGAVWITGTGATNGGFQIWRRSGDSWSLVDGGAVRIAVEPSGRPWVVNQAGNIFRRSGITAAVPNGTSWTAVSGSASDIAIGSNAVVYILGTDNVGGNYSIFRYDSTVQPPWVQVAGAAASIAVDSTGRPWVVNAAGTIFRLTDGAWEQMPGAARDIAAGPNRSIWIIGTGAVGSNYEIWSWNEQNAGASGSPPAPALRQWVKTLGAARTIAVAKDGAPWVIAADGAMYQRDDF